MRWLWQWYLCRVRNYHTWIDANGDGLTDTCVICRRGVLDSR